MKIIITLMLIIISNVKSDLACGCCGNEPCYCEMWCVPSGICCREDGSCLGTQTQAVCSSNNGYWLAPDTTCIANTPNICATGACCDSDGSCLDTLVKEACESDNGYWLGQGTSCTPGDKNVCITGACCASDDSCLKTLIPEACAELSGKYVEDGTSCVDGTPDVCATGACCSVSGNCEDTMEFFCNIDDGLYFQGHGTTCEDDGMCFAGACCFPDGSCTDFIEAKCVSAAGFYNKDTISCSTENDCHDLNFCIENKCRTCIPNTDGTTNCTAYNGNCCGVDNVCSVNDDLCMPCLDISATVSCNSNDECCHNLGCQFDLKNENGKCCSSHGDYCSTENDCCTTGFCIKNTCSTCIPDSDTTTNCTAYNGNCCGADNVCSVIDDLCMPCLDISATVSCNSNDECCHNLGCQFDLKNENGKCCILPGDKNIFCLNDFECCGGSTCDKTSKICRGINVNDESWDSASDRDDSEDNIVEFFGAKSNNDKKGNDMNRNKYYLRFDNETWTQLFAMLVISFVGLTIMIWWCG
eukprot:33957_1